jgi:hypothetical protein
MPLFDNGFKLGVGLAVGVGVLICAPVALPALAAAIRPIAKASIKSGIILIEKTKELMAEAQEKMEDIAAEVQAELLREQQPQE